MSLILIARFLNIGIYAMLWAIMAYNDLHCFMCVFITISFLLINILISSSVSKEKIPPHQKAILITGCDTGFGHHLAKSLDTKGFSVFACCLFPEGAGASDLRKACSDRLKVLPLNVTKDESVANALKFVKESLGSNARIALGDCSAYVMSKRAVVAFSDCLSLEMIPWGVKVISIEPEAFSTSIMSGEYQAKLLGDTLKEKDEDNKLTYGEDYYTKMWKISEMSRNYTSGKIGIVLDDIESAICDKNPQLVYRSSRNSFVWAVRCVIENLPTVLYQKLYLKGMEALDHPFYNIKNV